MILTLLITVALAIGEQMVVGSGTVWAQSGKIASEETGAAVTGKPGIAIDSKTLDEFDKCRAAIDFARTIKEVQVEIEQCKAKAREKSKPLEHLDFGDVKQRLTEQQTQ
jgi:hypothetical protein